MTSALGSNLSELDRLLLELNAVQQSSPSFPTTGRRWLLFFFFFYVYSHSSDLKTLFYVSIPKINTENSGGLLEKT